MGYVLITPARNEAAFLQLTLESMVRQTVPPVRWIIVSDGSTDGTDELAANYAAQYSWIEVVRMPERRERHFAGKVLAFNAGRARLADIGYDIIGNLDADVSFEPDYFEFLLQKFAENPRLGVAGTPFREGSFQYDFRYTSLEHVSGQIQLFRRQCFDEIGGYLPIPSGGIDLMAVITARMKGWQTRTFTEKWYEHHRKMSSAKHSQLGIAFYSGRTDYTQGCDPVWEVFRSLYQMKHRKPLVLWGAACMLGYFWALLTRAPRVASPEMIKFRRHEQMRRLRQAMQNLLPGFRPMPVDSNPGCQLETQDRRKS